MEVNGRMKVFFDGNVFTWQKRGGISRIFFELLRSFGENKKLDQVLYRGAFVDKYQFKREWFKRLYGFRKPFTRRLPLVENILDDAAMALAYKANASEGVIFHASYYRLPKRIRGPVVVHTYDMIHERFQGSIKALELKKTAFDKADLIISISESTKQDLCEFYQVNPDKIIIAYPGVNDTFKKPPPSRMPEDNNIKRPYMLYVGDRHWYKNFDLLLDTIIRRSYYHDYDLLLVGGSKELTARQQELVAAHTKDERWLKQAFCSDSELADLYANAAVFICTSLYEGFGIPLVEAMACECPVIAPNTSSIPEVVGDAALLFDPNEPDDLERAIEKFLSDKNMAPSLVKKGLVRASYFNWENMAKVIYEGYTKIA